MAPIRRASWGSAQVRHAPEPVRADAWATDRRYLADLRCLPGETDPHVVLKKGRYLNRELLEKRLARRYAR